jgi:hypothetical protein
LTWRIDAFVFRHASHSVTAGIVVPKGGAERVIVAGSIGGFSPSVKGLQLAVAEAVEDVTA